MKILVQWTLADPGDWIEIDLRTSGPARRVWDNLPIKPVPGGGEVIDNVPGWLYDLNIQGVELGGHDHYTASPLPDGLEVTVWNDDPEDWPPGTRNAQVWTFLPPRPDLRYDGQLNTDQSLVAYDERVPHPFEGQSTSSGPVIALPWSSFVIPITRTIHGIWVSDELSLAHRSVRSLRGWRDWP